MARSKRSRKSGPVVYSSGKRRPFKRLKRLRNWKHTGLWYHLTHQEITEYVIQLCKCNCPSPKAFWFYRALWRSHCTNYGPIAYFDYIDALKKAWEWNVIEEEDFRQEVAIVFWKRFTRRGFVDEKTGRICVRKKYFFRFLAYDTIMMLTYKKYIPRVLRQMADEDQIAEFGYTEFYEELPEEKEPAAIQLLLDHKLMNSVFCKLPIFKRYFTYLWYVSGFRYARIGKALALGKRDLIRHRLKLDEELKVYFSDELLERPRSLIGKGQQNASISNSSRHSS